MTDQIQYRFARFPDGEHCAECGQTIHSGWFVAGVLYGPSCGLLALREAGVAWSPKWAAGAFDPEAMAEAIEAFRWENGRWVHPWDERRDVGYNVGTEGKHMAQLFAMQRAGSTVTFPGSPDHVRCYQAGLQALGLLRGK